MTPKFIVRAAIRYALEPFLLRDADAYLRHLRSPEWIRVRNEVLAARPICERTACGQPAAVVQHRRFDVLGREPAEHVEALRRDCHSGICLGLDTSQLALFTA